MGISVGSIGKTRENTGADAIFLKDEDSTKNSESIFSSKENKTCFNAGAISIAGAVLLGIAGICFAPKLLKFIKNCKLNTNIRKGLSTAKPQKVL